MDEKDCVIYSGDKFILEWYYDNNGKSVAYDYFLDTTEDLQDKFLILIKKMGILEKLIILKNLEMKGMEFMHLNHNLIYHFLQMERK